MNWLRQAHDKGWIAPDGNFFKVDMDNHWQWIVDNRSMLEKKYKFRGESLEDSRYLLSTLFQHGWIRCVENGFELSNLSGPAIRNIEDFVLENKDSFAYNGNVLIDVQHPLKEYEVALEDVEQNGLKDALRVTAKRSSK